MAVSVPAGIGLFALLIFCITQSSLVQAAGVSKAVHVQLRAKWIGTPLLLEAGEFLAQDDKGLFWQYLDRWQATSRPPAGTATDRECVAQIVGLGKALSGATMAPLLELALTMRTLSPKIVLYRQLAQESLGQKNLSQTVVGGGRWEANQNPDAPGGECCWVDTGGEVLLGEAQLTKWLEGVAQGSTQGVGISVQEFDHIHPNSPPDGVAVALYGTPGTTCFEALHVLLAKAAEQNVVRYIFRPVLANGCEEATEYCARVGHGGEVSFGGYGVEMALKNMEYKAIDDSAVKKEETAEEVKDEDLSQEVKGFVFSTLVERKPELREQLLAFRDHLLTSSQEAIRDTYSVWELKDLGIQATQRIVQATEPLKLLQEISQNFPNLVTSLSRVKVDEEISEELHGLQKMVQPGRTLLTLNGIMLDLDSLDVFSLLKQVQSELKLAAELTTLQIPPPVIRQLSKLAVSGDDSQIRLDFRHPDHIQYMNDIEHDREYRSWRSNLNELLMPAYPGQMRSVRKNIFHAVYVIDPASATGFKTIDEISYYYRNRLPIRLGVLLASPRQVEQLLDSPDEVAPSDWEEEDLSDLAIRMFLHLKSTRSTKAAFEFFETVAEDPSGMNAMFGNFGFADDAPPAKPITQELLEEAFIASLGEDAETARDTLAAIKKGGSPEAAGALHSSRHVLQLGLGDSVPCLLFNGQYIDAGSMFGATIDAMNSEMQEVQRSIYYQQISQRTDVLAYFLKNGVKRYNAKVLGTNGDEIRYRGMASIVRQKGGIASTLQYLHQPGTEDDLKTFSHWLILDLCSSEGLAVFAQALRHLGSEAGNKGRVAVLHNPSAEIPSSSHSGTFLLPRIIQALINIPSRRSKLVPFLTRFLAALDLTEASQAEVDQERARAMVEQMLALAEESGLKTEGLKDTLTNAANTEHAVAQLAKEKAFVMSTFGLSPGGSAIITNGRVLELEGSFVAEDFFLLEAIEAKKSGPVAEQLASTDWGVGDGLDLDDLTSQFLSNRIMAASSEVWSRERKGEPVNNLGTVLERVSKSRIEVGGADALFSIEGILDPLSPSAQAAAPLLAMLQDWLQPSILIVLNPQLSLSEVPLKNFYRYAQPPKDDFSESGALGSGASVVLANLPQSRTLTMNLKVPEPWLVEPTVAVYDLDNLVLEKIPERIVHAVFELEALVITGHCYEMSEPPRGLQLVLGTPAQPHAVDTIVMANLGYFQLKAAPGLWTLQLAPGRSSELYTLAGVGAGTPEGPTSMPVVVGDLRGKLVRLEVVKRDGREREALLQAGDEGAEDEEEDEDEDEDGSKQKAKSVWGSVLKAFGGNGKKDDKEESKEAVGGKAKSASTESDGKRSGETINIFSIASGHLYERFTKIMILSVLRNTRRPVKFWFIKNYLSPGFKDTIPVMAHHYGFEAELVTYKWPSWLHKQTEKQRLIWAYKILFLDVLFPLSLKKVIFVDADQVVRTDMAELYDMDLQGRPLAYTPMCDNNVEMEGYRFWKRGFWKDHLQGRPYHISALYVVDLVRFRQLAAGDQLRVFYENLSKDPNSLANLDQDLPNYAQHMVPIFSLPQHWLWCESWCGTATKAQAKTIDLCNNPMTKEPKLEGARRIVAEWPELDEEQRRFTEAVESGEIDLEGVHSAVLGSGAGKAAEEQGALEIEAREAEEASRDSRQEVESGDGGRETREEL